MNHKHAAFAQPRNAQRTRALPALLVATALSAFLGGCVQEQLPVIRNEADFNRLVLESKQPVIVEFSKDECPTCVALEPKLIEVSKEYQGRAKFYKFMLLNRFFQHYCPAISQQFHLQLVPTAVLFVDGQEKQRWFMDYMPDTYRNALTELVGPPAAPGSKPYVAPSRSSAPKPTTPAMPTGSAF